MDRKADALWVLRPVHTCDFLHFFVLLRFRCEKFYNWVQHPFSRKTIARGLKNRMCERGFSLHDNKCILAGDTPELNLIEVAPKILYDKLKCHPQTSFGKQITKCDRHENRQ